MIFLPHIHINKKDNTYSVSADVTSKNEFESMIEGTVVFKSWISR